MMLPLHGVGGSTDLPIPFGYAVVGASWALTISFAVLALAWKQPRFVGEATGAEQRPRRPLLAVLGFALTCWILGALYLGPEDSRNGGVQAIYVLVWVGLVPLAIAFGHIWRDLSPWRTIQAAIGKMTGRSDGFLRYPAALGYWPAAVGLFAFVWLELASPDPGSVSAVGLWVAVYAVVTVLGGVVFGPQWFDRADPFDVYSAIVARLSPFVRDGRWVLHNPLRSLPAVPVHPGLVAVLAVLLGSTAYDSFSSSQFWQSRATSDLTGTLTLLGFCVVVGVLFVSAAIATGGLSAAERRRLPGLMAHSLVPIVAGYMFAHYLTYLLEKGQLAVSALIDPNADYDITYFLSEHTSLLAVLKVGFVLAGHVLAVIAAHDKSLDLLPRSHRLTGQLAMLLLMVGYTFLGLYLLFSV